MRVPCRVQYRVAFGKKDEAVEGPDDADVVITIPVADATLDPSVAFMQASSPASAPSAPMTARVSESRTGSNGETMAPRLGSNSTRPSVASTLKASRKGVRDTPSWAVSKRSFRRAPACRISSRC